MKRLLLLGLVVVFLVAGCATLPVQREIDKTFDYEASFDEVWAAVIGVFGEMQLPIDNIEKDSGLIITDWIAFDIEEGLADCGSSPMLSNVGLVGRFNVVARKTDSGTQLTVNAMFEAGKMGLLGDIVSTGNRCYSLGALEEDLASAIGESIGGAIP